jgi:hypothetical protein
MVTFFEQFLGADPGIHVEIVDKTATPYKVRSEDGFEFLVSEDDFRSFYRESGSPTPRGWEHFVTERARGFVECDKMSRVLAAIRPFEEVFQNFQKARAFVREALVIMDTVHGFDGSAFVSLSAKFGISNIAVLKPSMSKLMELDQETKELLLDENCANVRLPIPAPTEVAKTRHEGDTGLMGEQSERKVRKPASPRTVKGMKNIVMKVDGDMLTMTIDLSEEFGPSKSGKTTIVASTEGSKSIPGMDHRIGMTVYRVSSGRAQKGSRNSFKNVLMDVEGSTLTVTVDLTKEYGASKSGKTLIVASTEGNQLVFGRQERIGLNVYRKIE